MLELIALCSVQKIGNSLYLRIPAKEAQQFGIKEGTEFTLSYDHETKVLEYKPKEVPK